jgi:AcrR family transcriptional regulator
VKKSELTAKRILEAAAQSIATVGIEKASITDIARRAGVSRALVAHYFPKKSELFPKVIQHIAQAGYRLVEQPRADLSPAERVMEVLRSNFEFWFAHPEYFKCFFLFYYFASIDARYRQMNSGVTERAIARFEGLLKEHVADRKSGFADAAIRRWAESLHRELIGSVQQYFIVDQPGTMAEYQARALENFRLRLQLGS